MHKANAYPESSLERSEIIILPVPVVASNVASDPNPANFVLQKPGILPS